MDSIIKGYPIGTLIFWRTKERLRFIRNIGNIDLPEPRKGEFISLVLDGQQRLASLYSCMKGVEITKEDGRVYDYSEMYVDLEAREEEQIVITDISNKKSNSIIKLTDLLNARLTELTEYPKKHHEKLQEYKQQIESYTFPVVIKKDIPIDVATEIFTRINTGGKDLTVFEIMVAKTFDPTKNFDLSIKYKELVEGLEAVNYETVPESIVLQSMSLILEKECNKKEILNLKKGEFIDNWDRLIDAIERTVDYFRLFYRVPVSKLLPYNALIPPFVYFFYNHKDKPTGKKQRYLKDFFWRCALGGRYSSSVPSKLASDIKKIDLILKNQLPKYEWAVDTSTKYIESNDWFSAGSSYIKAILCIYAYHQPKTFNDTSIVQMNNQWLKQANSKNYHHFFPKDYLKNEEWSDQWINSVLNITIVDDFLNKRKIRTDPPSKYMKAFKKINPDLEETMKTHLIMDLEQFGVWNNDYETFLKERAKVLSKEFRKRIIKQKIDKAGQTPLADDSEEFE